MSVGWSDIKVSEFPAVPEIEGYEGVWNQTEDIGYFFNSRQDITCWYCSTDKYSSTGMPKSFIVPSNNGRVAFTLSEYPIKVVDDAFKYVNETNLPSAASGLTQVTEANCADVVEYLGDSLKTQFESASFKDASDILVAGTPDLGFVNAVKVMRQETGDNTWSIPRGFAMQYVLKKLIDLGTENTYYSYLSPLPASPWIPSRCTWR